MQQLVVEFEDFYKKFTFSLNSRSLHLTPDVAVQYYWIDPGRLRDKTSLNGLRNLHSAVALFREAVRSRWADNEQDLRHVAAATAYVITRSDKSTQRVLRDAFPSQSVTTRQKKGEFPLSDEDNDRLARIVAERDCFAVAAELDRALGYTPLSPEELERHWPQFEMWIDEGVESLRSGSGREFGRWYRDLESEIRTLRKTRGDRHRALLNAFAYECKASFYHCHANAWSGQLLPWLIQHRDLDPVSQQFLAFWNCQQRPVEIPHGISPGGILYPTRVSKTILGPDGKAFGASCPTDRIGADHHPAVFRGQILALHPLSGFFMSDPACRLAAARFFATDAHDFVFEQGGGQLCSEYWDLVHCILLSALRYRDAQQAYENKRAKGAQTKLRSAKISRASGKERSPLDSDQRDRICTDLVRKMNKFCPQCRVPFEFRSAERIPTKGKSFPVRIECGRCHTVGTTDIFLEEFRDSLQRLDSPAE